MKEKDASLVLTDAENKLDLLKKSSDLYSTQEYLQQVSSIKKKIVSDTEILKECDDDMLLAQRRKNLLSEIQSLIFDVLNRIANFRCFTFDMSTIDVRNYSKEKKELRDIAIAELNELEAWSEQSNAIFGDVQEINQHIDYLKYVKAHCENDKFRVLLLAEYQSGKTTFLNSLCGRFVGPMGKGTTTSAVPLSVSYGEKDYVNITWRTKRELQDLFVNINPYVEQFDFDHFDLDDEKSRCQLLSELDTLRKTDDCPLSSESSAKYLPICSFILQYYNSSKLDDLRTKDIDLNQVASIVSFPKGIKDDDFVLRWLKNGNDGFVFEDTVFCFLKRVDCRCFSSQLKEMNCVIVDCPGLSSSNYDTSITESEMLEADAIVFLTRYDKAIGEQDNKTLNKLKNTYGNIHRKLVVLNNYTPDKDIISANENKIRELFGNEVLFVSVDVFIASIGSLMLSEENQELTDYEREMFLKIYSRPATRLNPDPKPFRSLEEAYEWQTKRMFGEKVEVGKLLDELYAFEKELIQFVYGNRAYSVIISNGLLPLKEQLDSIRKQLKVRFIDPYIDGKEKTMQLWDRRLLRAKEFQTHVNDIVHDHIFSSVAKDMSLSDRLSEIVYSSVFTDNLIDSILMSISDEIYENKMKLFKVFGNENKMNDLLKPIVSRIFKDNVEQRLSWWNYSMQSNQEYSFSNVFEPEMRLLEAQLKQDWSSVFDDDDEYKNMMSAFLTIPKSTKEFCLKGFSASVSVTPDKGLLVGNFLSELGTVIASVSMLISSYICFLFLSAVANGVVVVSNPWTLVAGMVAFLGGGIIAWIEKDKVRKKFCEKMSLKLRKKIQEEKIEEKFKRSIYSMVNIMLSNYAKCLSVNVDKIQSARDISVSSSDETVENNCFVALDYVERINAYVSQIQSLVEKMKCK